MPARPLPAPHAPVPLGEPLLEGARAIAQFIGIGQRRVYFLHERKELPTFMLGGRLCARPAALREHLAKLERGAAA